jgi:hypothetical protein
VSRIGLVIVVLLSGCNASPESFWKELQRQLCKYNRDCGLKYDFDSVGECAEARFADSFTPEEFEETCGEYARETAADCLRYVRTARDGCVELERYPLQCTGVCGPGSLIQFAVEQSEHGVVVTPSLEWEADDRRPVTGE